MKNRDPLETCPEEKKPRYQNKAKALLEKKSRASAIKLKCMECCAWQWTEVKNCKIVNCALWGLGGQK